MAGVKKMKRFKMPTAYTILISIIIIVAILTWFVPAGQYEYVDPEASKKEPIPGTYHQVEQTPQGFKSIVTAPVEGFYDAVDVALFVIVIGGFLGVIMKTGAIDAGIARVTKNLKGKEKWMIPILMILFSLGGTSFGMAEETIAFYPLLLPVFIAAGYDSLTAVGVIMLGAGVGVLGSTVNPFATGVASGFAGLSIGEGIGLRLAILVAGELAAIIYVMRYAEKIKKDPSKSIVYYQREENEKHFLHAEGTAFPELTDRRKLILALFAITFVIMVFGVIPFSDINITWIPTLAWWFGELTALFFVSAVVIGLVAGLGEEELVSSFVAGARDLLGVALIIGISRGITIVMNAGNMTDTVLNVGEKALSGTGGNSIAFIMFAYLFYLPMSFLIPSTSGLATLTMPIMAPLSGFAGVASHLVITAYQSASGLINLVTPTSAVVMGGLAIARVSYEKWIRFVWKLLIVLMIIIIAALIIGVII
jgi:uncharacterized ion transporter superfamily protein YfcC